MITTEIMQLDPLAEKVLRTAARLGIKKYRLGFVNYSNQHHEYPHGAGAEMIANFKRDLAKLRDWLSGS